MCLVRQAVGSRIHDKQMRCGAKSSRARLAHWNDYEHLTEVGRRVRSDARDRSRLEVRWRSLLLRLVKRGPTRQPFGLRLHRWWR